MSGPCCNQLSLSLHSSFSDGINLLFTYTSISPCLGRAAADPSDKFHTKFSRTLRCATFHFVAIIDKNMTKGIASSERDGKKKKKSQRTSDNRSRVESTT